MKIWIFEDLDDPSDPLPLFLVQVFITLIMTRVFGKLCRYIHEPVVVGEIIAGIVIGPSVFGLIPNYTQTIWPAWSLSTFNVAANIGLIFFMFLLGVEVDYGLMKKMWRTSVPIAIASIIFPFGIGALNAIWMYDYNNDSTVHNQSEVAFYLFAGSSFSFTAFPVLASLLVSTKLLNTPIGIQALSTASLDDVIAWCVLAVSTSFATNGNAANGGWVILAAVIYIMIMFFVIKPIITKIHDYFSHNGDDNLYFVVILFLLMIISAFTTEVIGIHAFFGAFIAGVIVPKDDNTLTKSIVPKLELMTNQFFLPLYFASSGIKTNIGALSTGKDWGIAIAIFFLATFAKFTPGCLTTKLVTKKDWKYCVTIGVLMNTRGLVEILALNVGLSTGVLSVKLFTILVLMAIFTTLLTSPILWLLYGNSHIHDDSNEKEIMDKKTDQIYKIKKHATEADLNNNSDDANIELKPVAASNENENVQLTRYDIENGDTKTTFDTTGEKEKDQYDEKSTEYAIEIK